MSAAKQVFINGQKASETHVLEQQFAEQCLKAFGVSLDHGPRFFVNGNFRGELHLFSHAEIIA